MAYSPVGPVPRPFVPSIPAGHVRCAPPDAWHHPPVLARESGRSHRGATKPGSIVTRAAVFLPAARRTAAWRANGRQVLRIKLPAPKREPAALPRSLLESLTLAPNPLPRIFVHDRLGPAPPLLALEPLHRGHQSPPFQQLRPALSGRPTPTVPCRFLPDGPCSRRLAAVDCELWARPASSRLKQNLLWLVSTKASPVPTNENQAVLCGRRRTRPSAP